MEIQSTQVCISLKSLFSRHKGIGVQFTDEPTGNLDKKTGEDTLELLETCSKKFGATLIVVTHDLDIARKSDVVIHIEDGKIVEC